VQSKSLKLVQNKVQRLLLFFTTLITVLKASALTQVSLNGLPLLCIQVWDGAHASPCQLALLDGLYNSWLGVQVWDGAHANEI
jgi:hypothetical protein